ncbi:MAG: TadA family conjugal transfer-associated ATPase [Micrococcales bacterium]|nr:TadA family conjugal transfer-associated ATPase [Micrococcales bacterium]
MATHPPTAHALLALLADPEITDVLVNGPSGVWADGPQGLRKVAISLGGAPAIRALACQLASLGGQRLDDASPAADVRLPGGVRMHAILAPIARGGPFISLRSLRRDAFSLDELVECGTIPPPWAGLVESLVRARVNFLISGATGAGKTTLLSALLGLASPDERIVCIEEAAEISTPHPHVLSLEARHANAEGRGEITLTDLVRHALRMRPDRIVLGECRGAEVREVLTALNTGHEGSAATIHANAAADVPARLAALGALAGMDARAVATQTVSALSAVLHVERARDRPGARRLTHIAAIVPRGDDVAVEPALTWTASEERRGPGWARLAALCAWEA